VVEAVPVKILTARCQRVIAARITAHLYDAPPVALRPQTPLTGAVAVVEYAVGYRAAVEHGVEDAGRLLVVAGPEERIAAYALAAPAVALASRDSRHLDLLGLALQPTRS